MKDEVMKVWITKFALTIGIYEVDAELIPDGHDSLVTVVNGYKQYFHKADWRPTKEEAITRADQMRTAKLKSLQKQIDALTVKAFE